MDAVTVLSKETNGIIDQLESFEAVFYDKVLELFNIFEACRKTGILINKRANAKLMRCIPDGGTYFDYDVWQIGSYIVMYKFNDYWKYPWFLKVYAIKKDIYGSFFPFNKIEKVKLEYLLFAMCKLKDGEKKTDKLRIERATPFHNVNIDNFYSFIMALNVEIGERAKLKNIESLGKMEKLEGTFDTLEQVNKMLLGTV